MQLGLNDIHPGVGDILKARLGSMLFNDHARPEDAQQRTVFAKRLKGLHWRVLGAGALGASVIGGTVALSGARGAAIGGLSFLAAFLSAIGTGVGSTLLATSGRNTEVSAEELRALATGLDLGKPETIYMEQSAPCWRRATTSRR